MHLIAFRLRRFAELLAAMQHKMHFGASQHALNCEAWGSASERTRSRTLDAKGLQVKRECRERGRERGMQHAALRQPLFRRFCGPVCLADCWRLRALFRARRARNCMRLMAQAVIRARLSPGPCRSPIAGLRIAWPGPSPLAGSVMHAQRARTSRMSRKDCSTVRPDVSMMASALLYIVVRPARMRFRSSIASWLPCMGR